MFMVCDILGLCCIVNCNVCMFLLWLPYGVINYNTTYGGIKGQRYAYVHSLIMWEHFRRENVEYQEPLFDAVLAMRWSAAQRPSVWSCVRCKIHELRRRQIIEDQTSTVDATLFISLNISAAAWAEPGSLCAGGKLRIISDAPSVTPTKFGPEIVSQYCGS